MTAPVFCPIGPQQRSDDLIELNVEYMQWVADGIQRHFGLSLSDLVGMPVADYVRSVIDKVCGDPPPRGIFYLVEVDGTLAAMGGLRFLREGVAEIKRLYVRPTQRGAKLGDALLRRLLDDARGFGYTQACLDSAPFMTAAQGLYRSAGFVDCAAYAGTEVPTVFQADWRFMQLAL